MLLCGDPGRGQSPVGRALRDGPSFAGRERLLQERKIGERRHGFDAGLGLEPVAQRIEIELGFEVVHAGFENRLAMKSDPETDRARAGQFGQYLMREVLGSFLWGQVQVGKDHDARRGVLEHLGAHPACDPAWNLSRS